MSPTGLSFQNKKSVFRVSDSHKCVPDVATPSWDKRQPPHERELCYRPRGTKVLSEGVHVAMHVVAHRTLQWTCTSTCTLPCLSPCMCVHIVVHVTVHIRVATHVTVRVHVAIQVAPHSTESSPYMLMHIRIHVALVRGMSLCQVAMSHLPCASPWHGAVCCCLFHRRACARRRGTSQDKLPCTSQFQGICWGRREWDGSARLMDPRVSTNRHERCQMRQWHRHVCHKARQCVDMRVDICVDMWERSAHS